MTRGCHIVNHCDVKHKKVHIILPPKIMLQKFRIMIPESNDVPRKRWWDDSAEFNAATDKTCQPAKNPRIQSLLDEVVNDGIPEKSPSSTMSQAIPQVFPDEPSEKVLPKPSPEVVAMVFQQKEQPEELAVPRTKGDIIGFSDASSESDDESIDIQPNVNFLPATVEGLRKLFHELYTKFTQQGKHEHRNEVVFLFDELLRQQGIDREE